MGLKYRQKLEVEKYSVGERWVREASERAELGPSSI